MIDIANEHLLALREVPAYLARSGGRRMHRSTAFRWVLRGVGARRLESVRLGGVRYTSVEALARFADHRSTPSDAPLSARREAEIARAEEACARAGI